MNKISIAFLPFLLAGFILPDDRCKKVASASKYTIDQSDGPYILYKNDKVYIKYIFDENGIKSVKQDSIAESQKESLTLTILTDEPGKTFEVKLKKQLQNEKTEFSDVNNRFIVSDIEGNFRAFRQLLQGNKIIDENFNWTFGNGHLVLTTGNKSELAVGYSTIYGDSVGGFAPIKDVPKTTRHFGCHARLSIQ